jgi:hypothetical protein
VRLTAHQLVANEADVSYDAPWRGSTQTLALAGWSGLFGAQRHSRIHGRGPPRRRIEGRETHEGKDVHTAAVVIGS